MRELLKRTYNQVINCQELNSKEVLDFVINNYEYFDPNWHALGFIHCKLMEFCEGTLRLHIWEAEEKHPDEQKEKIHDHLFSLNSLVIYGTVKNEYFDVSESSVDKFTHYAYTVKYGDKSSCLQLSDKVYNVKGEEDNIIKSGEYYGVNSSRFHRSSIIDGSTALTLVATYDHLKKEPTTLSNIQLDDNKRRDFISYDKLKWRDKLLKIRQAI